MYIYIDRRALILCIGARDAIKPTSVVPLKVAALGIFSFYWASYESS